MEFSIQELIRPTVDILDTMICDKTAEHILPEHKTFFEIPQYSMHIERWCILSASPLQIGCSRMEISSPYGTVQFNGPVAFLKPVRECISLEVGNVRIDYTSTLFAECSVIVLITTLKMAIELMKGLSTIETVHKDSIVAHDDTHVFFKISKKILE